MAIITGYAWYYLVTTFLVSIALTVLFVILIRNFLKKRTIGTILLLFIYGMFTLALYLFTFTFWIEAFVTGGELVQKMIRILQLTATLIITTVALISYHFATRHIIRHNDVVKMLITIVYSGFVGVLAGLGYNEISQSVTDTPQFYAILPLAGTNLNLYFPPLNGITIFFMVVGSLLNMLIIYRAFLLSRRAKDIVTRKGFIIITLGFLFLWIEGFTMGLFYLPIENVPILNALSHLLWIILILLTVIMAYLGWIMPDWLRRRFRGKSWIAKVYTGKIPQPKSSSSETKTESFKAVEVAET